MALIISGMLKSTKSELFYLKKFNLFINTNKIKNEKREKSCNKIINVIFFQKIWLKKLFKKKMKGRTF